MTVKLYAMTCGHLTGPFDALMEGGEGQIDLPIPSFLIEHPKGLALYDTGMHPQLRTDPRGRLGERVVGMFDFSKFGPKDDIKSKLDHAVWPLNGFEERLRRGDIAERQVVGDRGDA